ncbi:MAG: hypothetical protein QF541_00900 [Lentisphaeria bacterium]|jgi:hypothetical protein|nr:hypothetical protein [Lentisphaeria bacterium]
MTTGNTFKISFSLANPWKFPLYGLPLRCSVPLPEGAVQDPAGELVLIDDRDGTDCAAQWRVLSTWNDGSARFALMDYAEAEMPPRTTRTYSLVERREAPDTCERTMIAVTDDADSLTVDTGRLAWRFSRQRFSFGESIRFGGRDWIAGRAADLCITDEQDRTFRASQGDCRLTLEENGPYRVIVRLEGVHGCDNERFMDYTVRFHFTAGGAQVLMLHHIRNRHGGREGRRFRRCWLEGALDLGPGALRRVLHRARGRHTMQGTVDCPERVDIDVDARPEEVKPDPFLFPKSDRELAWREPLPQIRSGDSLRETDAEICPSLNERGPARTLAFDRRFCEPLIDLHEPGVGGMLFRFLNSQWEYPFLLGSEANAFEIDFFPAAAEPHHFGEGMGKTRDVLLNFHDDSLDALDRVHESANLAYPGVVSPGARAYREAEFADMHRSMPFLPNKYPLLESKIDLMRGAPHGLLWPGAVGWRDYGDERCCRGELHRRGIWQFTNNEEDYLHACMLDSWRRGQPCDGAEAVARHLMDIDYIDYSDDPGRDGADCPHSEGHTGGEVYPSHQWCQGLLYYHLVTGDEEARRIARRIGDCLCWWITGPMNDALRGSGRECAWPLLSLAALYEVTHETRYREAALKVIDDLIAVHGEHGGLVWEYPLGSGVYSDLMLTMTFNGIWDVWTATGEARVLQLWKDITAPVLDRLENPEDWGYVIFRNWGCKVGDLTVLARWYELTGDERYIRLGRNGLRLILAGCPQRDSAFHNEFAMWYRHTILFLKLADELGMIDDDHCTLVW